ncbi:hypothetical protein [Streptomyces sp. NPDC002133]|uniref:hypothetical protein n=1 Tax=Streptomyces sp. NPDC002133 TaxID=3154409 RepID=UPI00331F9BC0
MADITIDTSALSSTKFKIPQLGPEKLEGAPPSTISLVPGTYSFQQPDLSGTSFSFTVTEDGLVTYGPDNDTFLQGKGTPDLTVRGLPVTIQTGALSEDLKLRMVGTPVLTRGLHHLTLVPGRYGFFLSYGVTALEFRLDSSGQVTLPPEHTGYATATGTTLEIRGYTITLDFRQLSHDLRPDLLGNSAILKRATTHQLTLVPGQYRFFLSVGAADLWYRLAPDGKVTVLPEHTGYATATGTTLEIRGYTITLDFRQLSHDLRPDLLGNSAILKRATTHQLTLVPGQYRFFLSVGAADLWYRLAPDGKVTVLPEHTGYATATGTTLEIRGYTISLDFHGQFHDLTPDLLGQNLTFPYAQVHQLTLAPGMFILRSRRDSLCDIFVAVRPDGSLYPA